VELWRHPARPWVAPFAIFFALLGLGDFLGLGRWDFPLRVALLAVAIWACSREVVDLRAPHWAGSVACGLAVFALWVAPDALFPGYRAHWLFQNAVMGRLSSSIPPDLTSDTVALVFRAVRAVLLVPILEELFWRGWLMRWLIDTDFRRVPLGAYAPQAFWITAALFGAEHGPYWDVGLLAGVAFNWWMVRTRSLGDCILAHAVANAALSAHVVGWGRWEYWL
jgi:CAAX prenyl protease-like protein